MYFWSADAGDDRRPVAWKRNAANSPVAYHDRTSNFPRRGESVSRTCRTCGAASVVPVLDKRIEHNPTGGGNRFRQWCTSCHAWQPSTSKDHYEQHPTPYVLPVDGDPNDPETIVPLTAYDYGPEWDDLVERIKQGQEIVTDGGVDQEDAEGEDGSENENENEFDCPECGTRNTGFPECCADCGAVYRW